MKFFQNLSIKNKIVLIILTITIVIMGIGFTVVIATNIQALKADMQNNTTINARLIGDYCVTPLSFEDKSGAKEILESLATLPTIVDACVYDENGNLFVTYKNNHEFNIPEFIEISSGTSFKSDFLEVYQPIIYQGKNYGTIFIIASIKTLDKKINHYIIAMLLLMIGLLVLTYLIASKLQKVISNPILKLAEVTDKISDKADYSLRVERHEKDEISKLYDGFNNMLDQINERLIERDKVVVALRESEERFRNIYENSTVGIYQSRPDGKILMANPILVTMHGYPSIEEFIAVNADSFYVDVKERMKFLEILRKEDTIFGYEKTMLKKDGSIIIVSESARLVKDSAGNELYYEGTVEDITHRKTFEKALIEAREKAEEADRLKSEFLAQISHEIRSPMNVILNFTSLIKESVRHKVDNELFDSFESIDNAGLRIIRTIDLILNMSEVQTGSYQPKFKEVDIYADILASLEKEYSINASAKNLKLNLIMENVDPKICVDEYSIKQVFANLIDNAIKYTSEGKIDLILRSDLSGRPGVAIADTGMGISSDYIDHIFEPFSQEESGYTRKFDGTGLGLSLVKKYCELNNAEINVVSAKGKGTTFTVTFNERDNHESKV